MNRYQKMSEAAKATATPEEIEITTADQVQIEAIDWCWPNRFALGKLGLLGGNPERGKGLIIADMFSRITRGAPWPCNEGSAPQGDVVLLQQEDDLSDTVVPRLKAAGADLKRVHMLQMIKKIDGSGRRMFDFNTDLSKLWNLIAGLNDPVLLTVDPLTAYIGRLNAAAGNEVRSALAPLVDLLKHFHIAGLGVMHFNKKIDVDNALARIADSVAFGALARHCFVVTDDPENERRLLVKAKNNLAPDVKALSYTIRAVHAGNDHRDGRDIYAPRIDWGYEHVEISAVQAMRAETNGSAAKRPRDAAKELLQEILASGEEVSQKDIEDRAEAEGVPLRTLRRAKKDLGILSKKNGAAGGWFWQLPNKAENGANAY